MLFGTVAAFATCQAELVLLSCLLPAAANTWQLALHQATRRLPSAMSASRCAAAIQSAKSVREVDITRQQRSCAPCAASPEAMATFATCQAVGVLLNCLLPAGANSWQLALHQATRHLPSAIVTSCCASCCASVVQSAKGVHGMDIHV
ncbi:unnamed protein product [Effrenium voratum]|uniref:Uncharacterized protein n=1 Tax=Effrenium voratum TaxID=2562239 RepID=A0AA36I6L3_9DINO|nr:unnamed protein product [Effrenium voratum]